MHSRTLRRPVVAGLTASALALTGCSLTSGDPDSAATTGRSGKAPRAQEQQQSAAVIASSIERGAQDVDLTRKLRLTVQDGTFEDVQVATRSGTPLRGRLPADKTRWVSHGVLASGTRYKVASTAVDSDGLQKSYGAGFRARALSLDEQTYPSFAGDGQTVGVGMPVIVRLDVPVSDKTGIEKRLRVTSKPAQVGSFHWISDNEVHWRPRTYWEPGTRANVKADAGGVPAGNGIYGQEDRSMNMTIGDAMISEVDMNTHQMKVFRTGQLPRTIPITTGEQPKFTTRSGTEVIVEKFRQKRMNSENVGISRDSADGYDIDDVEYAMRVTYSGEFIHAGDVVEHTGTGHATDLTNGFGDSNASFADYGSGSALS